MRYFVTLEAAKGDDATVVDLTSEGVQVDGRRVQAELTRLDDTDVHALRVGNRVHRVLARRLQDGRWVLHVDGTRVVAEALDERTSHIREMAGAMAGALGPRPLKAPMPGLVVKIEVAVGDVVAEGDGMMIVEAMKMENELRAEGPARVTAIHVAAGDAVEKDQVMIELAALDEEGDSAGEEAEG